MLRLKVHLVEGWSPRSWIFIAPFTFVASLLFDATKPLWKGRNAKSPSIYSMQSAFIYTNLSATQISAKLLGHPQYLAFLTPLLTDFNQVRNTWNNNTNTMLQQESNYLHLRSCNAQSWSTNSFVGDVFLSLKKNAGHNIGISWLLAAATTNQWPSLPTGHTTSVLHQPTLGIEPRNGQEPLWMASCERSCETCAFFYGPDISICLYCYIFFSCKGTHVSGFVAAILW